MTTSWSLAQACVWIATRDASLANNLHRRCTIFEAGFIIFDGALTKSQSEALNAGVPDADTVEIYEGITRRQLVWDARAKLLEVLRSKQNKLIATGRANGVGDMVQIEPRLWLGLTLHDEPGEGPGHGVVARPEDGLNFSATWFDEITFAVCDVQRVWPVDSSAAATFSLASIKRGFDDDALVAEVAAAVRSGEFKSALAAARARKRDIQGGGAEYSKVRRIAKKVLDQLPRSSR